MSQFRAITSKSILADPRTISKSRVIQRLNKTITVSEFTTNNVAWNGSSYIVARGIITKTVDWSILMPVARPNDTFVAAIRWVVDDVVHRYKLWSEIGEILSYPLYAGEIIPAGDAILELWCVREEDISSADEWTIPISESELPSDPSDTASETYTIDSLCITLEGTVTTLEEYLGHCANP